MPRNRRRTDPFTTGLVLAAGGSSRLGQPKQLLPFGPATLLDHVLSTARDCRFDQLVCVIGGGADEVREGVDFRAVEIVENAEFGSGCASSIAAAVGAVDVRTDVLVLMLGDQPGVTQATVHALLAGRGEARLAACSYDNGRGHPMAFARSVLEQLSELHGDKGVWKLLDQHADWVADVPVAGPVPRDVDTWEDYEAALSELGALTG
jgi:molybdenum cofactor cytidylyltransferase